MSDDNLSELTNQLCKTINENDNDNLANDMGKAYSGIEMAPNIHPILINHVLIAHCFEEGNPDEIAFLVSFLI